MGMHWIRPISGCVAVAAALALTGCSVSTSTEKKPTEKTPTASAGSVENTASKALKKEKGQAPDRMDCPHSLKLKVGKKMRCKLTNGGESLGTTVVVKSVDKSGNYGLGVQVDDTPSSR